jgi:hypothetical protein
MSEESKKDAGYIQNLWRPMMGWMYMVICLADMLVFPVLWSLLQAVMHQPITQWNPLTLQGAGLFHIAMGAVLGISAFGRTQEKLAGTAANPTTTQTINTQNMTGNVSGGFSGGQQTGGFGSNSGGFGSAPTFGAPSAGGFGGNTGGFGSSAPSAGFGGSSFGSTPSATPNTGSFGSSSGVGATTTPALTASGKKIVPPQDDPVL